MTTNPNEPKPEFPNYFDPDREAKAAAAERAARAEQPIDASPGEAVTDGPGYAAYPGGRDGRVEIDELGQPVDPNDPDLDDPQVQEQLAEEQLRRGGIFGFPGLGFGGRGQAAGSGPQLSGFPFPGIRGTTRNGMSYSVGGCCLPIPLTMLAVAGSLVGLVARGRRG